METEAITDKKDTSQYISENVNDSNPDNNSVSNEEIVNDTVKEELDPDTQPQYQGDLEYCESQYDYNKDKKYDNGFSGYQHGAMSYYSPHYPPYNYLPQNGNDYGYFNLQNDQSSSQYQHSLMGCQSSICYCPYCVQLNQQALFQNDYSYMPIFTPNPSGLDTSLANAATNFVNPTNTSSYIPDQSPSYLINGISNESVSVNNLIPVYINQPVSNNTDYFHIRQPLLRRESNMFSWLTLYMELETMVESPTQNARMAWMNDMHHVIYTKLTSGAIPRWQYEYDFSRLKNLIDVRCLEADNILKIYPLICKCGERCRTNDEIKKHSSHCKQLNVRSQQPNHRCLCGGNIRSHNQYFQHIFNGELGCGLALYHFWLFYEKYRRRRYKCPCERLFYNFWVFFVHLCECQEYKNLFFRSCVFCKDSSRRPLESQHFPCDVTGPLKDLVLYSKLQ